MDAMSAMSLNAFVQSVTTYGRATKPTEQTSESAHVEPTVPILNEKRIKALNSHIEATPTSGDVVQDLVTNPNVTSTSEATTEQLPRKIFTRPQSSDGNLSSGFTFEKAPGLNLNMGRNFGPLANMDSAPAPIQLAFASSKGVVIPKPGLTEPPPAASLAHSSELCQSYCSSDQGGEPEQKEEQHQEKEPHTIQALSDSRGLSRQAVDQSQPPLASSPQYQATELPQSQHDDHRSAIVEGQITENATHEQPTKLMSAQKSAHSKARGDIRRPMKPPKPTSSVRSRSPLGAKFKVTKSRHKTPKPSTSTFQALGNGEDTQSSLTDEELLAVLLSRYRSDKQARDQERAAHATEVQDLKDITNSIWEQLQDALATQQLQCDELTRLRDTQPKLVEKFKNFRKYVDGLNRDHDALRDKARAIQDGQSELQQEKGRLFADVHGIRQQCQATLASCKVSLNEAQHEISLQSHTIVAQEAKIKESAHSLSLERSRNDLILAEIGKFHTGHKDFAQASAAQGNAFVTKLNDILSKLEELQQHDQSGCYEELKAIMCQCTATVDMLRDSGSATSEDIRLLDTSIKVNADGYVSLSTQFESYEADQGKYQRRHPSLSNGDHIDQHES